MKKPLCVIAEVVANLPCELYEISQDDYGLGRYIVKLQDVSMLGFHVILKSFGDAGFYMVGLSEIYSHDGSQQEAVDLILQEQNKTELQIFKEKYNG